MTGITDVAKFSSLGKGDDIDPIIEQYGMVIMDECHHGAAQTVEDVVGSAKAKYVYGLTATPKREDGLEKKVFMQFGPIRFRYTAKERAKNRVLPILFIRDLQGWLVHLILKLPKQTEQLLNAIPEMNRLL